MTNKAIEILQDILENDSKDVRLQLFNSWKDEWLLEITEYQDVINNSVLTSSEKDFVCEYITNKCVQLLLEHKVADIKVSKNRYNVKLLGLRYEKFKKS